MTKALKQWEFRRFYGSSVASMQKSQVELLRFHLIPGLQKVWFCFQKFVQSLLL